MIKKVYYDGKLIPAKDWDFENKRLKVKEPKKKVEETMEEPLPEVDTE